MAAQFQQPFCPFSVEDTNLLCLQNWFPCLEGVEPQRNQLRFETENEKTQKLTKHFLRYGQTPCRSALDFWKIKFEKSCWMNLIFGLFHTWILQTTQAVKVEFELTINQVHPTWFFKNQVKINKGREIRTQITPKGWMVWILNHKITLYKGKYFHQCFVKHKQKPNINSLNTLWSDWNLEKIDRDVCSSDRNSCPNVIWLTFLNSCFLRMLIIITVGNVLKFSYRNSFKILYDYCSRKNFMSITRI